jgi:predicted dehydrogenase
MLNVAIVGCGLIGGKRAEAIRKVANLKLCFDSDTDSLKNFSTKYNCEAAHSLESVLDSGEIDIVLIATRHDSLVQIAQKAMRKQKNVFIEKPGAINVMQFKQLIQEKDKYQGLKMHIGYNHQYHPAVLKAYEIVKSNELGKIMFLRARYGHGGRLGYEKEWRANRSISGGGELIDQGSHLLDLSLMFLGDVSLEYSAIPTYYWDMEVEDNAFIVVKNDSGSIGFLHASCTEWKNLFSLEIYGETGKIDISGLGGSYGLETLTLYKMLPEMGPPISQIWEFAGKDESWDLEFSAFAKDVETGTSNSDNTTTSKRVLELIEQIYQEQET